MIPVICDKQMSLRARAKVYKRIVRPVLLYGAETRATKETDLKLLEKTEMRILDKGHFIEISCQERKDKSRARCRTGKREGKRSTIAMVWACKEK